MPLWTTLRAYLHQQTLGMREVYRDLYRHYKLERDRLEREPIHRSHGDAAILSAMHQAQEDQRQDAIERQIRRYYEASRFVTPRKPHATEKLPE
jgi:hypothetical protein